MAKYNIIPSSRTIVQSPISIGHKAEKGVEAIEFDLTAWVETYGSGTLTVIMRRWGDAIPYPIALEIDENNKATWTLSDIDTAKAGMAYAQLSYIVGDEVVKKSDIYTFRVMDSLTGEGEPPEAYESWLEHLTHLAAEAMAEVLDIEGIVTDKTLTVDGGIADAKATGDALALKADKSTTYTKAEVDQMIEDVEVETDTTLSVSGAPADAKKTGDELSALKADLGAVVGMSGYNMTDTDLFEQGAIKSSTGENVNNTSSTSYATRIRTKNYLPKNIGYVAPAVGYKIMIFGYSADDTYLGVWVGDVFSTSSSLWITTKTAVKLLPAAKIRLVFANTSDSEITPTAASNCTLTELTDSTLTKGGISADAEKVGNEIDSINAYISNINDWQSEITQIITPNIINPAQYINRGYRYDFDDGTTHVESTTGYITPKIDIGDALVLYVRQNVYTSGTSRLIIYYYSSDDTYLGYNSVKLTDIGTQNSYQWSLASGTRYIVVYCSVNAVTGDHLCISLADLPAFLAYREDVELVFPEKIKFGNNKLFGTKIANFGDSIFGNKRPPNDISTFIAEQTGATVYNLGFGGCRMSESHNADWDAFSMASLATAIASNDFTDQDAVNISTAGMPSYFAETLTLLKSINFDAVDIITIAYGTNDFGQSADFDNPNNLYDKTTFCGALRYSLETLMTAFPHLKVFVCTPTYRFWMTEQGEFTTDSDAEVRNGKKLTDFVQAVIEIAETYHVTSIDNYYALGINKFNRSHWFPETDGTHHNKLGAILIAEHMVNEMF